LHRDYIISPYPINKWWPEPSNTREKLTIRDAGFCANLPVPPLVSPDRNIDVIIALDASLSEGECAGELMKASDWIYAKYTGAHFPKREDVRGNGFTLSTPRTKGVREKLPAVQLLRDKSGKGPYVLYIPIAANHIPMTTYEFCFNESQRKELHGVVVEQWMAAKKMLMDIWSKDWSKESTKIFG